MKYLSIVFNILAAVTSVYPQESVPGLWEISSNNLIKTVNYLASKECAGRLPGHEGYNRAARYMASEFEKLNLEPLGDSGYFQNLNASPYVEIIEPVELNLVENGNIKKEYKLGEDFIYCGYKDSGSITAPLVFCGYGISEFYQEGYDDYDGIDVGGKIVLVIHEFPPWIKSRDEAGYWNSRAAFASHHGAVGFLEVVLKDNPFAGNISVSPIFYKFPRMVISYSVGKELFEGNSVTLKEAKEKIDGSGKPLSFPLNKTSHMRVVGKYCSLKPTMNVIGMLEGSDQEMKQEYIVVGAHLDALGGQTENVFMPGANDNATGCAAVLEIARILTRKNINTKRSVIFCLFTGEESDSMGSYYFVRNPPVPIKKIVAMFNLDCVGYGDSIHIWGNPILRRYFEKIDSSMKKGIIKLNTKNDDPCCDAQPFFKSGIPSVTIGAKCGPGIHTTGDTPDLVDPKILVYNTKLTFLVLYDIAMRENELGTDLK